MNNTAENLQRRCDTLGYRLLVAPSPEVVDAEIDLTSFATWIRDTDRTCPALGEGSPRPLTLPWLISGSESGREIAAFTVDQPRRNVVAARATVDGLDIRIDPRRRSWWRSLLAALLVGLTISFVKSDWFIDPLALRFDSRGLGLSLMLGCALGHEVVKWLAWLVEWPSGFTTVGRVEPRTARWWRLLETPLLIAALLAVLTYMASQQDFSRMFVEGVLRIVLLGFVVGGVVALIETGCGFPKQPRPAEAVVLNDAEFDGELVVRCQDHEHARAGLSPEVRQFILKTQRDRLRKVWWTIGSGWVASAIGGRPISSGQAFGAESVGKAIRSMTTLAALVEGGKVATGTIE